MSEFVYPLDGEQNYSATQAGAWHGTRTSGVWSGDSNLAVTVTGARELTLSKGLAWFTTDDFWGKVYCNTGDIAFVLPTADGALDRICRVVIRWNKTTNTGAAMLLSGDLASSPTAPARNTTDEVYDLVIADYLVQHGETAASAARLTDQRLNEALCGLMRDGVTRIPTATLEAQVTALLTQIQADLTQILEGQLADGAVTTPKIADNAVTQYYAATISTTWAGSTAPYTQDIAISGILASDKPVIDVVADAAWTTAEAQLEAWALVYKIVAGAGKITVYASEATTTAIPIQLGVARK